MSDSPADELDARRQHLIDCLKRAVSAEWSAAGTGLEGLSAGLVRSYVERLKTHTGESVVIEIDDDDAPRATPHEVREIVAMLSLKDERESLDAHLFAAKDRQRDLDENAAAWPGSDWEKKAAEHRHYLAAFERNPREQAAPPQAPLNVTVPGRIGVRVRVRLAVRQAVHAQPPALRTPAATPTNPSRLKAGAAPSTSADRSPSS